MPSNVPARFVFLRRNSQWPLLQPGGVQYHLPLSAISLAAARETLVTDTDLMATLWTGMFNRMLTKSDELQWRGRGPGIGSDAYKAYSGLLGRYVARAYLTMQEGVRALIPVDEANRDWLKPTFSVGQTEKGNKADWIGLGRHNRFVIAEAKATHYGSNKQWQFGEPYGFDKAMDQAKRTVVYCKSKKMPAQRWVVASQWASEKFKRKPMLLAWYSQEEHINDGDFQDLKRILWRYEISAVLRGLGYGTMVERMEDNEWKQLDTKDETTSISIGDRSLEPGFAAIAGPDGIYPLSNDEELKEWRRLIPRINLVFLSMSRRYVLGGMEGRSEGGELIAEQNWASHAGLEIAWAKSGDKICVQKK